MALRSIWSGSISFGLVNIPVKLFTAVREERVKFHLLHDQDHSRLQRKMVSSSSGKEVHSEHMVKGFEIAPDQYVIVQQEEIEQLMPEKSRTISIEDFVEQEEIDPIFYDRTYYLLPDEHAAKPYKLLHDAMEKSKRVGIARFVMRDKEYLSAIRPLDGAIALSTMHWGKEVVPVDDLEVPKNISVDDRQLKMAQQLIESLGAKFDPKKYVDDFTQKVEDLIERKSRGEEVVTQPSTEKRPGRTVNLIDALEASLAAAKQRAGVNGNGHNGHGANGHNGHTRHARHRAEPRRRKNA